MRAFASPKLFLCAEEAYSKTRAQRLRAAGLALARWLLGQSSVLWRRVFTDGEGFESRLRAPVMGADLL